ncbi:hypothetical protein LARI1_G001943 [Lachnellula arida]|uniref:Uncharacterized protein n=1 Tax=Lachnellula arida TaxID=1316785 RepID=A0A8T9BL59_9HELO|nr:hypothetical protein LARI1_G001943 [Lachnellula arida]
MSSHSSLDRSYPQVIEGQYLDQRKLVVLLRNVYGTSSEGKNNFKVELRLNRYKIYPSEHLSGMALTESYEPMLKILQDQIEDCRVCRRR